MRRMFGFVLAGALVPGVALAQQESVSLTYAAPEVGEELTVTSGGVMEATMRAAVGGQTIANSLVLRAAERLQVKVLAVEGGFPSQLRLRYLQAEEVMGAGDEASQRKVEPVAGKTYLVELGADDPTVTYIRGGVPGDEEVKKVRSDVGSFRRRDPICDLTAGSSLVVGETLEIDPALATESLRLGAEDGEVKRFSLTLEEIGQTADGPIAAFQARLQLEGDMEGGAQMTLSLGGRAVYLAAVCRLKSILLSGPVRFSGNVMSEGRGFAVRGDGTARFSMLVEN